MKTQIATGIMAVSLLLLPAAGWSQGVQSGTLAGVVKDTSGAVLPGVNVEAASPALIEKIRTVVTDGQGIYRIVDLRPGTYTVTFTLTGFSSFKREGIELSAGFAATVNADMAVGAMEETVTVSGGAPTVDVQNIIQQKTISREVRDALPLPSNSGGYVTIIPGATQTAGNQDVGGNQGENKQQFTVHGSRTNDFQQLRDGQFFGTMVAAGNYMSSVNPTTIQEINVLTAGGLTAESETGGAQINVIPRDGGNVFNGALTSSLSGKSLQTDNLDSALQARGATTAPFIKQSYEIAGGVGGPIRKDSLWFFASSRRWVSQTYQPGNYFNATQGTMFYTADLSRPAYENNFYNEETIRLTTQAAKHKFAGSLSNERNCNCFFNIGTGTLAPEATGDDFYSPNWRGQLSWNHAASNRLLLEGGGTVVSGAIKRRFTGSTADDISILDNARNFRYGSAGSNITGFTAAYGDHASTFYQFNQRFSLSYVTGSHSFKTGIQARTGHQYLDLTIAPNLSYTFNGVTPTTITYFAGPYASKGAQQTVALYGQDQWTVKRLTLSLGARFDYLNGWIPAVHMDAGTFVPARDFPKQSNVLNWKDISPRLGAAYDLFGTGRTAVKVFLGRYVGFQANSGLLTGQGAAGSMVTSATRSWADDNHDYIPQASELGALSNSAFGTVVSNTAYADNVTHGWQTRDFSWQGSVAIQHEIRSGLAVNFGYFRTSYGNFTVTNNLAVTSADYDPFCITAPTDSRLPGDVSGARVCGLYDLAPAKNGLVNNLVEKASDFGKPVERYNGFDLTMNARFGNGGQISGGLSTGRTIKDNCFVVDNPGVQFAANSTTVRESGLYQCRETPPWGSGTQVKFAGLYRLPLGLRVSATYLNIPGIPTTAGFVATNASIATSLGRNLSACRAGLSATACTSSVTVELIPNNALFTEGRDTQTNIRLTRLLRVRRMRVEPQFDMFNVFNSNQILVMNTRYASTNNAWLNVAGTGVLAPRVIRLGVQVNF